LLPRRSIHLNFYSGDEWEGWTVTPLKDDKAVGATGDAVRAIVASVHTIESPGNQGWAIPEDYLPEEGQLAPFDGHVCLGIRVLQNSTPWTPDAKSILRDGRVPPRFVCSVCRASWAARYVQPPYAEEWQLEREEWGQWTGIGWLTAEELGMTQTPAERAAEQARLDALSHESGLNRGRHADRALAGCPTCGHLLSR
jgi:hypothetical protein